MAVHLKDNGTRRTSEDRGHNSTFHENNNTVKNGPTYDRDHTANISIPGDKVQLSNSSELKSCKKTNLSKSPDSYGFNVPNTPPKVPPRPVIPQRPGNTVKSLSPPPTGPKPVTPPKPAPRAPLQTPGEIFLFAVSSSHSSCKCKQS